MSFKLDIALQKSKPIKTLYENQNHLKRRPQTNISKGGEIIFLCELAEKKEKISNHVNCSFSANSCRV